MGEKIGQYEAHCDRLIANLEPPMDAAGELRFTKTIDWVLSVVRNLSLTQSGSRVVQRVIDVATPEQNERLASGLHKDIMELIVSPHANHVLAKLIKILDPGHSMFIGESMRGKATTVAR